MFLSLFWKKDQSPVLKTFSKARKKDDDFYEISPTTDDCDITFLSPSAASDQRPSGDVYLVSMTGDRKFFHFYLVL